jgi:DNA-directed RNA polymerase subunit RPC12/RpoP
LHGVQGVGVVAIHVVCPDCGKRISAPEDYTGKKIECPRCRRRIVLAPVTSAEGTPGELGSPDEEADRRRLDLIARAEERAALASRRHGPEPKIVRRSARYLRLRSLSEFLLLASYLVAFLVMIAMGLTLYLGVTRVLDSPILVGILLIASFVIGVTLFLVLKTTGELTFLLADIADRQHDIADQLLADRIEEGTIVIEGDDSSREGGAEQSGAHRVQREH